MAREFSDSASRPKFDARFLKPATVRIVYRKGAENMRYVVARLLGVPASILVIWFVASHIL
jgi:hypothetical protein